MTAGARLPPSLPNGHRVYAIGDIHGRVDLLRTLHSRIRRELEVRPMARNVVVYLGDYIDRGGHSREVVDCLLDDGVAGAEAVHLMGNHEQFLLSFLDDPEDGTAWLFNGGDATLANYEVDVSNPTVHADGMVWLRDDLRRRLPVRHLDFFRRLKLWHSEGDYLFVHAGLRPGVALEEQNRQDLLWIRHEFLESTADFGKLVIHGHSPLREVCQRPNRIGIATGAYSTDVLTAIVLEGNERRFIQTGEQGGVAA